MSSRKQGQFWWGSEAMAGRDGGGVLGDEGSRGDGRGWVLLWVVGDCGWWLRGNEKFSSLQKR